MSQFLTYSLSRSILSSDELFRSQMHNHSFRSVWPMGTTYGGRFYDHI